MPDGNTHHPDFFETAKAIVAPPAQPLAHFIALERQADTVRQAAYAAEAAHSTGVHFGGMEYDRFTPRTDAQVEADAAERMASQVAFRSSPTGRFYRAALLIAEATGDCRLLSCADRGLATNHDRAAGLVASMEGPAADDCRAALADFVQAERVA